MKNDVRTDASYSPSSTAHRGVIPFLHRHRRSFVHPRLLPVLLTAVLTTVGCASAPTFRASPELPRSKGGIRTVGLLPLVIKLSEEQPRFGLNKLVEQVIWSNAAADAVTRAFSEEMAADHIPLVTISTDDAEAKDLVDLYNAVEFSIQRHAWEKKSGQIPPREPFPEKVRTFDYSLGPARELMERHNVDAVWIVRGFNLLPTTGAKVKEGVEVLLGILAAMGGAPVPAMQLKKIELRVALVDRKGNVLYFGVADEGSGGRPEEAQSTGTERMTEPEVVQPQERSYLAVDLRDSRVARHYIRAALSGYREGVMP